MDLRLEMKVETYFGQERRSNFCFVLDDSSSYRFCLKHLFVWIYWNLASTKALSLHRGQDILYVA